MPAMVPYLALCVEGAGMGQSSSVFPARKVGLSAEGSVPIGQQDFGRDGDRGAIGEVTQQAAQMGR